MALEWRSAFRPSTGATKLYVLFHGVGAKRHRLGEVEQAIRDSVPQADVFVPQLWQSLFSNEDPVDVTVSVVGALEEILAEHPYDEVVLVGYSGGGIIARKAVVYINGEWAAGAGGAAFEARASEFRVARSWAGKVRRLVLLAGMNQGWSFAPTANVFVIGAAKAAYYTLRALGMVKLLSALRRGEPFVSNLRLQWVEMKSNCVAIDVVQVLGTVDDVVSPADNYDLETGRDFIYLDVPASGHKTVIEFDGPEGAERRRVFLKSITSSSQELQREHVPLLPAIGGEEGAAVEDVVFVIHGIRDYGFWTAHIARRIVEKASPPGSSNSRRIVWLTPSYGFFAMLPFLLPAVRRTKVRWFIDEYVKARASFPNARISYVGHSNGTYLLVAALREYADCHFHNVVFAGSVARTDVDWQRYIEEGRVDRVLNYVANADWVVALFPSYLQQFGQDVGGAGWDSFATPGVHRADVPGGHGAALREEYWDEIADFIIEGPPPNRPKMPRQWLVGPLARVRPLVWAVLVGVVLYPLFWFLPARLPRLLQPKFAMRQTLQGRGILATLWTLAVRFILTRA